MSNEIDVQEEEESFLDRFSWQNGLTWLAVVLLFVLAFTGSSATSDVGDDVSELTNAVGTLSADVASIPESVEFDEAAFRQEIADLVAKGVAMSSVNASEAAQAAVAAAEDDIVAAVLDALLGPVEEEVIPTGTVTPEATETAEVTPTATSSTPEVPKNQMFVIVTRDKRANLRYDSGDNAKGFPIMLMTKPKVQFDEGTALLVLREAVKADGDDFYYEVVGPERGKGFYVRVVDVEETFK